MVPGNGQVLLDAKSVVWYQGKARYCWMPSPTEGGQALLSVTVQC